MFLFLKVSLNAPRHLFLAKILLFISWITLPLAVRENHKCFRSLALNAIMTDLELIIDFFFPYGHLVLDFFLVYLEAKGCNIFVELRLSGFCRSCRLEINIIALGQTCVDLLQIL